EIDAPVVRAAGAIPGETGLRVDRAIRLRRDEVEAAHVRVGDEHAVAEACGTESVRVDAHEQLAAALPALGQRADVHHLAAGADRDVAVRAVVRPGNYLRCREV